MTDTYHEYETDLLESLADDGLDPDDTLLARLFAEILWTFHWGRDREEPFGTVGLTVRDGRLALELSTWVLDSDSTESELKPLTVVGLVNHHDRPEEQIRRLVHGHLCHEADELMWFGTDRPYHPHVEEAYRD